MGGIRRRGDADPPLQRLPAIPMWVKADVMEDDYYVSSTGMSHG